jgi:undecaprenyl-diphosphatase
VLIPYLLGWQLPADQSFAFDVLVQLGTLLAVIVYFRMDLWHIIIKFLQGIFQRRPFETLEAKMGWYLILATIPAGIFGILIKDQVEAAFSSSVATASFLFVTAALLFLSEWIGKRSRPLESMTWKDALWIGCAQAISVFPGISRSGSTIAGGLARNLDRKAAARFSFLMSIPVMLAAGALTSLDLLKIPNLGSFLPMITAGFVTAAVVGYLSIHWLLSFLNRHSLRAFAIYCIVIATATLIISFL